MIKGAAWSVYVPVVCFTTGDRVNMDRAHKTAIYQQYGHYLHLCRRRKVIRLFSIIILLEMSRRFPDRRIWIEHFIARRLAQGMHSNLFLELRLENPDKYRRCLRMTPQMFDWLVEKIRPMVQKKDTHLRKAISPEERLSVTLRHLATGETQESLSMQFRMGQSTISGIIRETCDAIYQALKGTYLRFASSEEEWRCVAADFELRWNFPNCIGAMDGKHIHIEPPIQSGSLYFNYKESFSIVLLAIVDAQLRFIYVDLGTNGRIGDKGVWNKCSLKKCIDENSVKFPPPCPLPGIQQEFPYVIVGDEGFNLTTRVVIPYPKELLVRHKERRIFNYRLSRARRCSENAFGIIVNRFQILRSAMRYDPGVARTIVLAILCLHNLLRTDTIGRAMYSPPDMLDVEDVQTGTIQRGAWRDNAGNGVLNLAHQGGNRHGNDALELRNDWAQYFNGPGAVPWQDRMIGQGEV